MSGIVGRAWNGPGHRRSTINDRRAPGSCAIIRLVALDEQIRDAGVVGAGGAGFPTHVKAAGRAEVVIANGAECEPVLLTDQWVMANHPAQIVEALRAEASATGAGRLVIAVKAKYGEVIRRFKPFLGGTPPVELFELDDTYPSGDEHVMVHEVTGRVVPEGGLPLDVGALVQNVATLVNIRRAMAGHPVIHKHVTVAGEVRRPGVYIVPVGTRASEVIAAAGGAVLDDYRVIDGGPMMGRVLDDLDSPVTKVTSGLLVLPPDSPAVGLHDAGRNVQLRRAMAVCCQCRMCTDLCPRYLLGHRIEPHKAMRALHNGDLRSREIEAMAFLCCQCEVCSAYACPLGLSPCEVFAEFKGRNAAEGVKNPYRDRPTDSREAYRWSRVPKGRLTQRLDLEAYVGPPVGVPEDIPEPWEVVIPLMQHLGAPALPQVRPGDWVRAGDCIGDIPQGSLGARVHASIDGAVKAVSRDHVRIARS